MIMKHKIFYKNLDLIKILNKTIIQFFFTYLVLLNFINKFFLKNNMKSEIRIEEIEIYNIEKYYKLCNNGILLNKKNFTKNINPKISIITPIYNKEKYILRYLRSIQNQFFDNIEIIIIDDHSTDNSTKIIEHFQKEDERIILIKHKKNKGTLISRNEGVLKSNAEYLMFLDPDDLFSNDILINGYIMAKKYDYDFIRFNLYEGNNNINFNFVIKNLISKPIYQPELNLYLFYGLGKLKEIDFFITNKIIKKNIFIKALNSINKYYLNQFMIDCEDGLINFFIYKISNSYYLMKKIGYFYIKNHKSITKECENNFKKRIKSNFLYLKFIFQYTKNNRIEKNIANFIFFDIYSHNKDIFINIFKEIKEIEFYKEIIELYLNCKFISLNLKKILNNIIFLIKKEIK